MHDLVIIPRYQWLPLKPQTQRFPSQRTQDITFDLRLLAAISASWTPRRVASLQVEQVYGPWEHRGISVGIDVPKIGDFGHHQNKSLLEIILYPQELGDVKKMGHLASPEYHETLTSLGHFGTGLQHEQISFFHYQQRLVTHLGRPTAVTTAGSTRAQLWAEKTVFPFSFSWTSIETLSPTLQCL